MDHPKSRSSPAFETPPHGGRLIEARRLFPLAPEPFIDLSTGINPLSYPIPAIDDGSTDGTLDLLASKTNVEVRPFAYAFPDSFSLSVQAWRNACWKESRGEADWVIVTDVDEHLHHPEMMSYLAACKSEGVTYIPALGFDMVTESFPHEDEHLASTRTIGAPSAVYSKLRIFDPNAIEEVNYEIGAHSASPRGRLVLPTEDALLLLHYKHLGTSHVPSRHAALAARLRERDLKNKWGAHYLFDDRRYGQYLVPI